MQLLGRLEIQDPSRILKFLDTEHTGRFATIDTAGFPQIIPMNFVFHDGVIYMHSHTKGEKLDNMIRNTKTGFEIDKEFEFLPSYFEDEHDASLADTLYASVVIKGNSSLVDDVQEKCLGLNALMAKYQPEGRYDDLNSQSDALNYVTVIKLVPTSMRGKYKIGQHIDEQKRKVLAQKILERGSKTALQTLHVMGFELDGDTLRQASSPKW